MIDYLLDTNVIIDYLRGVPQVVQHLEERVRDGGLLCSCEITVAETFSGMRESEREVTERLLDSLRYIGISEPVARRAGALRQLYRGKGKQLTLADALIAALAMTHQLTLLTANLKDYPMPELRKESP